MRLFSLRAMTLSEVLVATVIVGIIGIGIMSADYAMRSMDANYTRDTGLYLRTSAIAEHVRLSASLAHGSADDPGWEFFNLGQNSNNNYMCFRRDGTPPTPEDYADDVWWCYSLIGPNRAARVDLYTCELAGPGACDAGDTLLGTLVWNTFRSAPPPLFTPRLNGDNLFEFQFVARQDPTQGADISAGDLTRGSADNPQVVVQAAVYPEQHSF